MLRILSRKLFFSVPSLKSLGETEKAAQLKEASDRFSQSFSKPYQEKLRLLKTSFSSEKLEKIELILTQLLKLNTFEVMALRKSLQANQESEYNWPVFPRPNMDSHKIPVGKAIPGLGKIESSLDLIQKIISGKTDSAADNNALESAEIVAEVVVEKTTFNIVLTGFDPNMKVKLIKCVKDVMGLGLKESKDKVEEANKGPIVLFKSVSRESHGKVLEQIIAAGGQADFQ